MQPLASTVPGAPDAPVGVGAVELLAGLDEQPASTPISSAPTPNNAPAAHRRVEFLTGWLLDRSDTGGFGASEPGRPRGAPVRARPSLAVPNAAGRRPTHRWQVFGLSGDSTRLWTCLLAIASRA